jgi:ATP phosphoribosyltransferase regulatory subunit
VTSPGGRRSRRPDGETVNLREVIHPIPSGTRDVLPDEMRELRAITGRIHDVFSGRGYGEVSTPALEYESTLAVGTASARLEDPDGARPVYRLFDEAGEVLVLRSDMTIPIARVAATRYATAEPPLRFCYFAHAYRGVRPQRGQAREFLQAGIELLGAPSPDGTVEAISVLCEALDAAGLASYRVGLGDATLYPALLDAYGIADAARGPVMHELVTRDFVGLEREVGALGLDEPSASALLRVPQLRGGPEVLDALDGPAAGAAEGLRAVQAGLAADHGERLIFDLGLSRGLGYYTGAVFEVYDPALGMPLGGGGRYDELLGRFGRDLPAVGFALNVEALHVALTGEERDA